MIINRNTPDALERFKKAADLINRICRRDGQSFGLCDLLFFDIETTGLSPDTSYLYLIGCMYLEGDTVIHEQFFSEGINEESELIDEFDRLLNTHKVLVHFNGQTFDIPYIDKKRKALGLRQPVELTLPGESPSSDTVISFDIFKYLRPFKKLLGLNSMSQKSLECFCGLNRKDIYDGGELIDFYNRYIAIKRLEELRSRQSSVYCAQSDSGLTIAGEQKSSELLNALLLHNYEDVLGMLDISVMLALPCFCAGEFKLLGYSISPTSDSLVIQLAPVAEACRFLSGRKYSCPDESTIKLCSAAGAVSDVLCISVPVFRRDLKRFYPDYKNYYYLPAEDTAIHKSIGEFLDKSLRTKCTAANCYTRHSLDFVPVPCPLSKYLQTSFTIFKAEARDRFGYADLNEITGSSDLLNEYIRLIIAGL